MNQRTQLPLTGIQRNKPDGISPDGTCQEILNYRLKDGALRVVGEKNQVKTHDENARYHFMHQISPTRKAWWITDSEVGKYVGYHLEDQDGNSVYSNTGFDTYSGTQDEVSFAALGNVVIMIDKSAQTLSAYMFDPEEDQYNEIGDPLPDLIPATIHMSASSGGTFKAVVASADWSDEAGEAELAVTIAEMRKQGIPVNKLYFIYAYELFDGTIVKHSQPIRIDGNTFGNFTTQGSNEESPCTWYPVQFNIIDTASPTLASVQSNYSGIIKGINVYVCAPSETHSVDSKTVTAEDPKLANITTFYLVRSWSLEELETYAMDIFDYGTGTLDLTSLELNDTLPYDNNTAHTLYSDSAFNYNQRLFWRKIKNTLFSGFHPYMSNPYPYGATGGSSFNLYCEVTIDTTEGQKTVLSDKIVGLTYLDRKGYLACFGYPDTRASKVKIIIEYSGTTYRYYQEFALTPHKYHNFAYAEDVEFDDTSSLASLPTEVKTYWDYNRIQATELMNPFYFPSANSYRVGRATIVGLSTNAVAISTGQYGEYPMYVFATDGLWALQVGSEDVLIQSIKPLGRHVCNNEDSIKPIDGGSVFSTEKGLFVITGEKVIEISQVAEGDHLGPICNNATLTSVLSTLSLSDYLCSVGFLDYLSGAVVGYNYVENEIIVTNSSYDYSWVYNIDTSMWYKIHQVWDSFIDDFPKMYGANNTNQDVEDITDEDSTSYVPTYIETRPFFFDHNGLKRLIRMLIEGSLNREEFPAGLMHLLIFGTTDRTIWERMYSDQPTAIYKELIGRLNYSVEMFILVIAGESMLAEGTLKRITMDVKSRFDKKLRVDM